MTGMDELIAPLVKTIEELLAGPWPSPHSLKLVYLSKREAESLLAALKARSSQP